jgi:sigma-B regulation protein RsbU (phosphoserine phosphatase)
LSEDPRQLEAAARLARLEDLFDNAPCGYITLLANGYVGQANATFCAWIGLSADALREKRLADLLTVPGKVFFETHCRPLLRMQGFLYEIALDLQNPAGERIPVVVNATEKRTVAGDLLETRMILAKAGDRRRYERGLVDARAEAQRALDDERSTAELREQFIAVLGHDLRNPLSGIMGVADYLQRENLSEKGTRFLRLMKTSAQRMAGLIDNILDFARGRLGGGIALDVQADTPVGPTLLQVVDELRISNPQREIVAELLLDGSVPLDHRRIAQLLSNLLGNALTHGASDRPVVVRAVGDDTYFELSVANAGTPIPAAARERLFQPFFREDVRASQQGLGLGLYIASEIVRAHKGRIAVTSDDELTRFTVRIPEGDA